MQEELDIFYIRALIRTAMSVEIEFYLAHLTKKETLKLQKKI